MHVTPKPPLVHQDRITNEIWSALHSQQSLLSPFPADFPASVSPINPWDGWAAGSPLPWAGVPPGQPGRGRAGCTGVGQPRLVLPKAPGAGQFPAAVRDHHGEIGDGDSAGRRNRGEPACARNEQGNRQRKTGHPDTHHDQVAALPGGNVRGQRRLRLGDQLAPRDGGSGRRTSPFQRMPPGAGATRRRQCPGVQPLAYSARPADASRATDAAPASAMTCARSSVKPSSRACTPSAPPQASAHSTGRPRNTSRAPRASAASASSAGRMPAVHQHRPGAAALRPPRAAPPRWAPPGPAAGRRGWTRSRAAAPAASAGGRVVGPEHPLDQHRQPAAELAEPADVRRRDRGGQLGAGQVGAAGRC